MMQTEEFQKLGKKGKYSGSERLDPNQFEEPDIDNAATRKIWLEDSINSPEYQQEVRTNLLRWKKVIGETSDPGKLHWHMVGQSHIDMAWLWRYAQTRKKAIKTFEKAIFHADWFPNNFKFATSSPQMLDWVKEDNPSLFAKIKDYHKKGYFELVGGSWVEPDCMMPGEESMIRQRLYGMRFYRDEFGVLPETEWFLDSFGYNIGLPQILTKSGAKSFWTTKITWNQQTKFPFVNFLWKSPDGSELLTTNFGQNTEILENWNDYRYGYHLLKETGRKNWNYGIDYTNFKDHVDLNQIIPDVGYFFGLGDGGHGPSHQNMVEAINFEKVGKDEEMHFHWSSVSEIFSNLTKYKDKLPIWEDELYLETHRGTFSVHGEVKRHNRRLESLMRSTETLATILSISNPAFEFPYEILEKTWKLILLNQFHDVLPGSSIVEVYDDVVDLWNMCDSNIALILNRCMEEIHSDKYPIGIFNPLSWKRNARIFIPISEVDPNITLDANGKPPQAKFYYLTDLGEECSLCQPVAAEFKDGMMNNSEGWWMILEISGYELIKGRIAFEDFESPSLFVTSEGIPRMTNGITSLSLDPKSGAITEIKSVNVNDGENLVYGNKSFLIEGYKDRGYDGYPAWNLSKKYWTKPKMYSQTQELKIEVMDEGPIFSTLKISKMLGESPISQILRLFKDDPVVYCFWTADWKEIKTMLKITLDTETQAKEVTVDEMYCALRQSTLPDTLADKARFEKTMHQYADLSTTDNRWGIALLNEGKYAFDVSAGRIRLTLHRAVRYPNPAAESWVLKERAARKKLDGSKPPVYSGIGPISARFAYYPHSGGCLTKSNKKTNPEIKKVAEEYNFPPLVKKICGDHDISLQLNDFEFLVQDNVHLTAIKRNEWEKRRSIIVRFAEVTGYSTHATVFLPGQLHDKILEVKECDLLERHISKQTVIMDKMENILKFTIGPFEVKTFELILTDK
ncbi:hypothetical protein NEF87_001227 [Candidatus Lokiarchaeum ossiferum]|uniref:Glycoside hydrolase family 38 central domain-containing protein n=1 Tax=Candidatus Lokiarchaeum ossiferum TaxID=2951803 RepID=A0ABY6HN65_9ARCH|nr:hypothetical protein NEF87_001227 [Candidatus Lokiarchaeum sp. B-35]